MLDVICAHIHNYFARDEDIHRGTFEIEGGSIDLPFLADGQYYRIVGSALNDGVYRYSKAAEAEEEAGDAAGNEAGAEAGDAAGNEAGDAAGDAAGNEAGDVAGEVTGNRAGDEAQALSDEVFTGEIWAMRLPRAFLMLAKEIEAWEAQYGEAVASPFQSENVIGVYSYTRAAVAGGDASGGGWQSAYRSRLNQWRRIRD